MNDQDVRQKAENLEKRLENALRIKSDLEKKAASLRKQESRRKCLTYDDLKGFWLGYPERPYPLLTQEDILPERPSEASRTQLTATWAGTHPPMLIS